MSSSSNPTVIQVTIETEFPRSRRRVTKESIQNRIVIEYPSSGEEDSENCLLSTVSFIFCKKCGEY
jgi:hypothetical protein